MADKEKYDVASINRLVLGSGGIRAASEEVIRLNKLGKVYAFKSPHTGGKVSKNGFPVFFTGYANYIMQLEKNYPTFASLNSYINELRSRPRPMECGFKRPESIDTWVLGKPTHNIYYKISNGQILIFNIVLKKKTWNARAKGETDALYKITKLSDNSWKKEVVTSVTTEYAAINGILNNLDKAIWLMADHLESQFDEKASDVFTLFHNPSGGVAEDGKETALDLNGKTQEITKKFANLLESTQAAGVNVKWVAHSQGGLIFKQAVLWLNNGRSDEIPGYNPEMPISPTNTPKKDDVKSLDKHSVAFHSAPIHNSAADIHLKNAKVTILEIRAHPNDAVPQLLGLNTINPKKIFMSIANLPYIIGGTSMVSVHTRTPSVEQHNQRKNAFPQNKKLTNIQRSEVGVGNGNCQSQPYSINVDYINNGRTK